MVRLTPLSLGKSMYLSEEDTPLNQVFEGVFIFMIMLYENI